VPDADAHPASPVSPEDRQLYLGILEQIAARLKAAKELLAPTDITEANVELAALHLRKVMELMVMGSLVTNRTEIEAITKALQRKKTKQARELAQAANEDYWPQGVTASAGSSGPIHMLTVPGALREDEWESVYGHLSELLHARNPYKSPISIPKER